LYGFFFTPKKTHKLQYFFKTLSTLTMKRKAEVHVDQAAKRKRRDAFTEINRVLLAPPISPHLVLGVATNVNAEGLKTTFRRLSLMLHPDKCSLGNASEAFIKVKSAHERLSTGPSPLSPPPATYNPSLFGGKAWNPPFLLNEEVVFHGRYIERQRDAGARAYGGPGTGMKGTVLCSGKELGAARYSVRFAAGVFIVPEVSLRRTISQQESNRQGHEREQKRAQQERKRWQEEQEQAEESKRAAKREQQHEQNQWEKEQASRASRRGSHSSGGGSSGADSGGGSSSSEGGGSKTRTGGDSDARDVGAKPKGGQNQFVIVAALLLAALLLADLLLAALLPSEIIITRCYDGACSTITQKGGNISLSSSLLSYSPLSYSLISYSLLSYLWR
jgi:uncharacterized membrane protein YgcG